MEQAQHELEKYAAIGDYLISKEAALALNEYASTTRFASSRATHLDENYQEHFDFYDYFSTLGSAATKCLGDIKREAKNELAT